jgi:hypothetical protein
MQQPVGIAIGFVLGCTATLVAVGVGALPLASANAQGRSGCLLISGSSADFTNAATSAVQQGYDVTGLAVLPGVSAGPTYHGLACRGVR